MSLTRQLIRLENPSLSIALLPGRGGRLEEVLDRRTGRQWAWHPVDYRPEAALAPRELRLDASFDENWEGGWDDIFPNDCAGAFNGFELADHGELWSRPWSLVEQTDSAVQLSTVCRTVPASVEKSIALEDNPDPAIARFSIRYTFRNLSDRILPFLFKLHPALPIEAGDRILMPRCVLEPVEPSFSTIAGLPGLSEYPYVRSGTGAKVRMDIVPPLTSDKTQQEFLYSSGLHESWCAIHNQRTSTTLKIEFDPEHIPFVWLFMSYGKWRDHTVVMPEPCTNKPYDLAAALARGSCARLEPREVRELNFRFSLIRGALQD